MRHYRRTTSCWLIAQALCFCLLLQGSGIAEAAAQVPPEQPLVSKTELEALRNGAGPDSGESAAEGSMGRFQGAIRSTAEEARDDFRRWLRERRIRAAAEEAPIRVAQVGGVLPLPPRLMAAFLSATSRGQGGPPRPPG